MKDLFTYPDNPDSYYVNPEHIGDGTYGMSKRIADVLSGPAAGKHGWTNLNPVTDLGETWQSITPVISAYKDYIMANTSQRMNTTQIWSRPIVQVTLTDKEYVLPATLFNTKYADGTYDVHFRFTPAELTELGWRGPVTGRPWTIGGFDTYGADFNGQVVYLELVNFTTEFGDYRVWLDSAYTVRLPAGLRPSGIPLTQANSLGGARFVQHASGVRCVQQYNQTNAFKTGDTVMFTELFTDTNAGDLNSTTQTFWVNYSAGQNGSDYTGKSFRLWKNSAMTTPAVVTEAYTDTITLSFNNTTGATVEYTLTDISTALLNSTAQAQLVAEPGTLLRAFYKNLSGGGVFTSPGTGCQLTLGSAFSNTQTFWAQHKSATSTWNLTEQFAGKSGSPVTPVKFSLSAGASVDIEVRFIQSIQMTSTSELYPSMMFEDPDQYYIVWDYLSGVGLRKYREVSDIQIRLPGYPSYSYLDSAGVRQYACEVKPNEMWFPGQTSARALVSDQFPDFEVTVNASGYLESVAIASGGSTGAVLTGFDQAVVSLQSPANQYVPPVPYAPDEFDTDDYWDSTGYTGSGDGKIWPTHVSPATAKVNISQPSSINRSQNGTKYVRASGVLRYQLELQYPPMTRAEFDQFRVVVEAARGQMTPFLYRMTGAGGVGIIFRDDDVPALPGENGYPQAYTVASGARIVRVEGLPPSTANVFRSGEFILREETDINPNGGIVTVVNNCDSNVFGETEIRLSTGLNGVGYIGRRWYKNPGQIIVTLAQDTLEYTIDTDGLIRFSVIFDLDSWKG